MFRSSRDALLDFIATDAFAMLLASSSCAEIDFKNKHLAPLKALKMQVLCIY